MYASPAHRFGILQTNLTFLLGSLVCSACSGAYQELEALRDSSLSALKRYAQEFASEDAKFEGVVKFGQTLTKVTEPSRVDPAKLTYESKDYWRAVLEMTPENSSILFAHAHLYATRGQTAWADVYFLLGSLTDGKSHRDELLGMRVCPQINN